MGITVPICYGKDGQHTSPVTLYDPGYMDRFKSRLDTTEEKISEYEDISEIFLNVAQLDKRKA